MPYPTKLGGLCAISPTRRAFCFTLRRGRIYLSLVVGAGGFEPPTSCSQSRRANQAALRPAGKSFSHYGPQSHGARWPLRKMHYRILRLTVGREPDLGVRGRHPHFVRLARSLAPNPAPTFSLLQGTRCSRRTERSWVGAECRTRHIGWPSHGYRDPSDLF